MKLKNSILFLSILACSFLTCGGDDSPSNSRAENFDFFWNTIDREYSYFELKGIDWAAIRTEFAPQVTETLTNLEFRDIFTEIIQRMGDSHTGIRMGSGFIAYSPNRGSVDNSAVNLGNYVHREVVNNVRLTVGDIRSKNVKYIAVRTLSGDTDNTVNDPLYDAVNDLNDYDGLIIDLRNNGGGNDAIAKRFVESFADQTRVFRRFRFREPASHDSFTPWTDDQIVPNNSINFTKPIVLLTNRHVVSSAEGFTLMLKSLPNLTHLGDTTAGSTGNPGLFEMPNGWELFVSRWQVTDPDGNYVEDRGLAPDQVVWISLEDRNAGKDTILEAAIALF